MIIGFFLWLPNVYAVGPTTIKLSAKTGNSNWHIFATVSAQCGGCKCDEVHYIRCTFDNETLPVKSIFLNGSVSVPVYIHKGENMSNTIIDFARIPFTDKWGNIVKGDLYCSFAGGEKAQLTILGAVDPTEFPSYPGNGGNNSNGIQLTTCLPFNPSIKSTSYKCWYEHGSNTLKCEPLRQRSTPRPTSNSQLLHLAKNSTYDLYNPDMAAEYQHNIIHLTEGKYSNGNPPAGGNYKEVSFSNYAIGNINGETVIAMILYENNGGNTSFPYLSIIPEQQIHSSTLKATGIKLDGDIYGISISNSYIYVKYKKRGPNDPFCCPSINAQAKYDLQNGIPTRVR
jgi:hypothetical protein